ncbi:hypothetical protein D3C84_913980 [compost metagenome]
MAPTLPTPMVSPYWALLSTFQLVNLRLTTSHSGAAAGSMTPFLPSARLTDYFREDLHDSTYKVLQTPWRAVLYTSHQRHRLPVLQRHA